MQKKCFSFEEAKVLGDYFILHPLIERVEIFGSISRNFKGNDFDLILIVSEKISNCFFRYALFNIKIYYIFQKLLKKFYFLRIMHPYLRLKVAKKILGKKFIENVEKKAYCKNKIDLFLLPENWKDRLEELQKRLPHPDKKFMWNIAGDAIILSE